MDEEGWLAEGFEANRARLRAVAYRMLGSLSEADDAVQEAWLRLRRSGAGGVRNLGGWLTTVVARVCLDMLRARSSRREEPLGVRLPDPVVTLPDTAGPEHQALLAEGVGLALLVVLDALRPAERLAFVLHARQRQVVDAFQGRPFSVLGFTVTRGRIAELDILADPARLRHLELPVLDG